uniref:Uncharacterized protein n=1 Tax=Medicago truncatula TaxID=3880 RepID=B7FFX5_MEDTR|nr:unknown [Medicago truncatula]
MDFIGVVTKYIAQLFLKILSRSYCLGWQKA